MKQRIAASGAGELLVGLAAAQLAGRDFLVGLDRQRADAAEQRLVPSVGDLLLMRIAPCAAWELTPGSGPGNIPRKDWCGGPGRGELVGPAADLRAARKLANLRRWLLDIVPAAPQVLQPLDAAIYEPDETKREAILARTKAADRSETYAAATRPRPPKWSAN